MSHTILTFCRRRGCTAGVGLHQSRRRSTQGRRSRGPESTQSSIKHVRDIHYKWQQSESLPIATWRRMECLISIERTVIFIEWTVSHSSSRSSQIGRLAVDPPHDCGTLDRGAIETVYSPEAPSDGGECSRKNSTITAWSNRDRGAIEPRSWILRRGIKATIVRQYLFENREHDRLSRGNLSFY